VKRCAQAHKRLSPEPIKAQGPPGAVPSPVPRVQIARRMRNPVLWRRRAVWLLRANGRACVAESHALCPGFQKTRPQRARRVIAAIRTADHYCPPWAPRKMASEQSPPGCAAQWRLDHAPNTCPRPRAVEILVQTLSARQVSEWQGPAPYLKRFWPPSAAHTVKESPKSMPLSAKGPRAAQGAPGSWSRRLSRDRLAPVHPPRARGRSQRVCVCPAQISTKPISRKLHAPTAPPAVVPTRPGPPGRDAPRLPQHQGFSPMQHFFAAVGGCSTARATTGGKIYDVAEGMQAASGSTDPASAASSRWIMRHPRGWKDGHAAPARWPNCHACGLRNPASGAEISQHPPSAKPVAPTASGKTGHRVFLARTSSPSAKQPNARESRPSPSPNLPGRPSSTVRKAAK